MDKSTLDFYASDALNVALRYESVSSPLALHFNIAFPKGGKILDIGCGSGRDLAELSKQGFNVYGVDPVSEFVEIAQRFHPELQGRISIGGLPDLSKPFGGKFDGVLCNSILMHIEELLLLQSIFEIKASLKKDGRVLISVPTERADADHKGRDQYGRLFKNYPSIYLKSIFEDRGFILFQEWTNNDTLNRTGIEWMTHLYQLIA